MTKFKKFTCPNCRNTQLEPLTKNSLITKVICRTCWYKDVSCNILGSK